jgi:RNA polymerase sigma factor (sigma-70 family)
MSIVQQEQAEHTGIFTCAQSGCLECMRRLLKQNELLVYLIVQCQCPGNLDYADLRQEGRIGLWQAILYFQPELGHEFWHYAGTVIRRRIWRAVQQDQKTQGWIEVERDGESLPGVIAAWQEEQVRQAMMEALATLPSRQQQIIELAYGMKGEEPLSLAEIGRRMNLTRERIRQLRNEALMVLKLPALSIRLRGLCGRNEQRDYRQSRRENDHWLRSRRGRKA